MLMDGLAVHLSHTLNNMPNIHKHTNNLTCLGLLPVQVAYLVEDNSSSFRNRRRNRSDVGLRIASTGITTTICLQDLLDADTFAHDYYVLNVHYYAIIFHVPYTFHTVDTALKAVTYQLLSQSAQPRVVPSATIKADQLASQRPQAGPVALLHEIPSITTEMSASRSTPTLIAPVPDYKAFRRTCCCCIPARAGVIVSGFLPFCLEQIKSICF